MLAKELKSDPRCPRCPNGGILVRHGRFYRKSERKWIRRWRCNSCLKTISRATHELEFGQKKRQFNYAIYFLLCSGVSQRRLSLALKLNRKTIARKLKFLAIKCRLRQNRFWLKYLEAPIERVQFDEMETSEHTKLKPLSIALAVCEKSRKILNFQVASMPARGHLASLSRQKYGPRPDERAEGLNRLFDNLSPVLAEQAHLKSDQNPRYPAWTKGTSWQHSTIKGSRGANTGQGELKKVAFDPLFSLNHTCAMIRANVNRMFRKTWCTTKKAEALTDHLWLYMDFHNRILT